MISPYITSAIACWYLDSQGVGITVGLDEKLLDLLVGVFTEVFLLYLKIKGKYIVVSSFSY